MKTSLKLSLIATLLAVAGVAYSQGPMSGQCDPMMGPGMGMQGYGGRHDHMGRWDPTRMQAMMEKRQAVLKAQLKLTPAQEGAWTAFIDSMKPAAMAPMQRPDPVDMAKLTTPERLDKMKALRDEHMKTMTALMDKHVEATKTFYAALTPDQQKVFDATSLQGRHGAMGWRHDQAPMPAKP
ncbi:Spy/CpxP family protein refolding chaperone [Rhodoferax sp.]|uniref:Spy/CpxP family protein refolding chaperone n=1 Tax=Rhodoferax sp. TaxID=50421 RepID=UPI0028449676|nr:Spy/CpxP family protein refolding chaperone [Rhodoferax sp.]MDR3371922.1 Spy/CpxP family protein refolding chaperone [Rhodoferax sp.]